MTAVPRLLFVHAHPDDETITCGGTMARYAATGAHVTVVTCTRGELGEVIPKDLAHLEAAQTEADRTASGRNGDELAAHREGELAEAMQALRVVDHRFLGDVPAGGDLPPRRFRDSGMVWGPDGHAAAPPDMNAGALCRASVDEAAAYLVRIVLDLRPDVVITYNKDGGYGHPDHVRTHDLTFAALARCADAGWQPAKVYEIEMPETELRRSFDPGQPGFAETGFDPVRAIPIVPTPDADVTTAIDISPYFGAKLSGLHKHATQVQVSGEFMALSNHVGQRVLPTEYYRRVRPEGRLEGLETDLLAGVEEMTDAEPVPGNEPEIVPMVRGAGGRSRMVAGYLFAVIVGILVALLGTVDHQISLMVGSQMIAVGLIMGLVAVALVEMCLGLWSRRIGPVVTVGVLCFLAATIFGQQGPGGAVLIPGNMRGVAWTIAPVIITFIMVFVIAKLVPARGPRGRTGQDRTEQL
ncbi:N-acetyl-1-D-myo-inositol-2-amino-2-deoxy-alpha-D-glucopyranoside deacetylase [Spelaeicoccus albus]|uniref:N-acetyl-1-D-myo-inositol-2-amino-2-deoxy-alpha-D-glucopyranoside deacetylase n=1 Tax=Spelaeicoccus albus TaxID=1280376 RepID=A0A7Z0D398_9MICO|nr:N-acetyl-1-D-myo-inositol-2-amino-2-deoxy-alpha-D-glucopyranoside deacetylase [Spelaeicoccus albus]NYI68069.1 N-acetyl-1-D-myo-inositol-2-amino-2-deoxy-alpha-D-glucopyranoside deacetylase [Spelaeicoccus albus]